MYSKEEASQLRQAFWTAFGLYLSPIPNAEGEKINWINYKTGVKYLSFKMDAGKNAATASIEIAHPDPGIQEMYFEQFIQLKKALHASLLEEWVWQLHQQQESGKVTSKIYTELKGASVFNKQDWPALISFFKQRIIVFDEFWSQYKYAFDGLQ